MVRVEKSATLFIVSGLNALNPFPLYQVFSVPLVSFFRILFLMFMWCVGEKAGTLLILSYML